MSRQKFTKDIAFIVIFPENVTTNVCSNTEMINCKKCKLSGMSRQCKTPSEVAHVIRTLSRCNHIALFFAVDARSRSISTLCNVEVLTFQIRPLLFCCFFFHLQ